MAMEGESMTEGYWVIRTYTAGAVGEKIKYWVPGEKPTRSQRKLKSDIKQQQRNEANAEKHLARLLNENLRTKPLQSSAAGRRTPKRSGRMRTGSSSYG